MSADLPRIAAVQFPSLPSSISAESRYWRKYKSPIIVKEYASVSHIHFSPASPHDFAVSASTRVQIYSSRTRAVAKTISRFSDITFGAEFRKDGKLIMSGDATGLVQVFDTSSRSILRTIDLHKFPVHVTKFSPHDLTTLLTASDDKTMRIWDMPTQKPVNTFKGNGDYVRTADFMPTSPSLFLSGCYDGTIRLWDARVPEHGGQVQILQHESNVEKVLSISGTTIVSAGGLDVRIWDLSSGSQKPLRVMQNHAKGVTSLSKNHANSRVLSGGLDGHLKIYDTTEWKVIHSVKYPNPILSCAVSPDDKHLVVGMSTGLLSIRTRHQSPLSTQQQREQQTSTTKKSSTVARFLRGAEYRPTSQDFIVNDANTSKRLNPWDKSIRKFAFSDGLDQVLQTGNQAMSYSVVLDLRRKSGLRQALSNRDELGLLPVLQFLIKALGDSRMTLGVIDVAMMVLEIYGGGLNGSASLAMLMRRLSEKVNGEVEKAKEAVKMDGMLKMLFVSA